MFSISRCTQVCINKRNLMYKPINSITLCSCHSTTYIWIFSSNLFWYCMHSSWYHSPHPVQETIFPPSGVWHLQNISILPILFCVLFTVLHGKGFISSSKHLSQHLQCFFFSPLTELGSSFTITWDVRSTFYSDGKWQPLQRTSNTNRSVPY